MAFDYLYFVCLYILCFFLLINWLFTFYFSLGYGVLHLFVILVLFFWKFALEYLRSQFYCYQCIGSDLCVYGLSYSHVVSFSSSGILTASKMLFHLSSLCFFSEMK